MRELERVKQYVKKINEAKSKGAAAAAEAAREVTLNKQVAARFVKHDLVTTAAPPPSTPIAGSPANGPRYRLETRNGTVSVRRRRRGRRRPPMPSSKNCRGRSRDERPRTLRTGGRGRERRTLVAIRTRRIRRIGLSTRTS